LPPNSKWKAISLGDVLQAGDVKKQYRKVIATLAVEMCETNASLIRPCWWFIQTIRLDWKARTNSFVDVSLRLWTKRMTNSRRRRTL